MQSPLACPRHPTSLPSDVWLEIIQFVSNHKDTIKSLASVNSVLRSLVLPLLFNTLKLTLPDLTDPKPEVILERIQGIHSSPHILDVIHRLNLKYWEIDVEPLHQINEAINSRSRRFATSDATLAHQPNDDADVVKRSSQISVSTHVAYQAMVDLVSSLPRLYRLHCKGCSITTDFLAAILRSSSLKSLCIDDNFHPRPSNVNILNSTVTLSLHRFEHNVGFRYPFTFRKDNNAELINVFLRQINQFTTLRCPISSLSQIFNTSNFPITLPRLQKLTLLEHGFTSRSENECIYNFLSLTPNLRELRIVGKILSEVPLILPDNMIPNLESLTAPSDIANNIVSGRALKKIHVFTLPPNNFLETYEIVSKEIKHVAYDGILDNPQKDLSHLARMFPGATNLRITAMQGCQTTHEAISHVVLSVLPSLPQLKKCAVFDLEKYPRDMHRTSWFHCPIGRNDDPKYRSHPTLQDIQLLSWYRWVWIPEDGWRATTFGYAPFDLLSRGFRA